MKPMRNLWIALIGVGLLVSGGARADQPEGAAPLVIASEGGPRIQFQVGADAFGGGLAGVDFIGGVNATFVYPVVDWLWVGIRPALHYVFVDDSGYNETWMHADAALHFNVMHEPVRVYFLLSGGYAFALDSNIPDLSHGFSVLGAAGVAWRPQDSKVGLFLELGLRYGAASVEASQLDLDERGRPVYDEASMSWRTEIFDRQFELIALTVNLGVTISP